MNLLPKSHLNKTAENYKSKKLWKFFKTLYKNGEEL